MSARRGRPVEAYQGLTERARAWIDERQAHLARVCEVSATTVSDWAGGKRRPSYDHVRILLGRADGLTLEDFGYTERPDGRVARLLAEGHAPAPLAFVRAAGDCVCEACRRPYHRHQIVTPFGADSVVLHALCDGRRVKL